MHSSSLIGSHFNSWAGMAQPALVSKKDSRTSFAIWHIFLGYKYFIVMNTSTFSSTLSLPQLHSWPGHTLQPDEASVYITRVAKGYFYPTGHIVYTPAQEQTQVQPQSEFVSLPAQHGCCTEWKTSLILKLCVCCESAGIDHKLS